MALRMASDADDDAIPDYCDLTPEMLAERRPPAIEMMRRARSIEDEDGGYTFVFPGDSETLQLVLGFAAAERRCCPMGTYRIEFGGEADPIRFSFVGPGEMKKDIREGMELDRWFDEVP